MDDLVERYGRYVMGIVRHLLRNDPPETHEELYQDAWLNIQRGAARFEARAKFTTYLYTIVKNTVFAFLDRRRRREAAEREFAVPEATGGDATERFALKLALEKIPEADQEILLMKYTMELSYDEIAAEIAETRDQVRHRLIEARKRLRIQLETRG